VRKLGWANIYFALIIPPLFHAYGIFFFRQFFLTIPIDLKEAAIIDGCSIFIFGLNISFTLLFCFRWKRSFGYGKIRWNIEEA
jgi:ABC-type glycerol-3-phosphate transport system permease component